MKYAYKADEENIAKAYGRALDISTKKSVEICNVLRGKNLKKAKTYLEKVIKKEKAVPIKRYGRDTAHKPEIAGGKYPVNAAQAILDLLKSAESNAANRSLDTNNLVIEHISAHLASRPWHYGRKRRSRMKRTHVQVVLKEGKK